MQGCINFLFSSIQRFLWMDQDSTLALSSLLLLQARFSLHSHAHITNVICSRQTFWFVTVGKPRALKLVLWFVPWFIYFPSVTVSTWLLNCLINQGHVALSSHPLGNRHRYTNHTGYLKTDSGVFVLLENTWRKCHTKRGTDCCEVTTATTALLQGLPWVV